MAGQCKSDGALRKSAEALLKHALKDEKNAEAAMERGAFRIAKSILFTTDEALEQAHDAFVRRAADILGPKQGNIRDIDRVTWDYIADLVIAEQMQPSKAAITGLLEEIEQHAAEVARWIAPARNVRLSEGVESVQIGPVSACSSAYIAQEMSKEAGQGRVDFHPAETLAVAHSEGRVSIGLPCSWQVHVAASPGNLDEEALWLVDIALSLLRFASFDEKDPFFPSIGKVEAHPTAGAAGRREVVSLRSKRMSLGGFERSWDYALSPNLAKKLREPPNAARIELIFGAPRGTVAERISHGLGWLSRARRTADRAERFLLFFTAIESLLSSSDRYAPVVQTIANYTAVILTREPGDRFYVAETLAGLYGKRSDLVHRGHRNVNETEVNQIQYYAEALFVFVLDEYDLSHQLSEFHSTLKRASYGLPWPLNEGAREGEQGPS